MVRVGVLETTARALVAVFSASGNCILFASKEE